MVIFWPGTNVNTTSVQNGISEFGKTYFLLVKIFKRYFETLKGTFCIRTNVKFGLCVAYSGQWVFSTGVYIGKNRLTNWNTYFPGEMWYVSFELDFQSPSTLSCSSKYIRSACFISKDNVPINRKDFFRYLLILKK